MPLDTRTPRARVLCALVIVLIAAVFAAIHFRQASRVVTLSEVPDISVGSFEEISTSETGYAEGIRKLLVPNAEGESIQVIVQTQNALQTGDWLRRHYGHDNAPYGRSTHLPLLHRFAIGGAAWLHHHITDMPAGVSVEWAAVHAETIGLGLIILLIGAVLSRRGDPLVATLACASFLLFPLLTSVVPGAPNHATLAHGLTALFAATLSMALRSLSSGAARLWAGVTGLVLGCIFSLNTPIGITLSAAIATGALVSWRDPKASLPAVDWRALGLASGFIIAVMAGLEGTDARLDDPHFFWAFALAGLGESLSLHASSVRRSKIHFIRIGVGLLCLVSPIIYGLVSGQANFWVTDILRTRLTGFDGEGSSAHVFAWLQTEGVTFQSVALLSSVAILLTLLKAVRWSASSDPAERFSVVCALVILVCACVWMRWWNVFAATLILPLALIPTPSRHVPRKGLGTLLALAGGVILSLISVATPVFTRPNGTPTPAEGRQLQNRDFAHWLAHRSPGVTVLAPPALTQNLVFHGGLRGIGTFDGDNRDGFLAAKAIANALSTQEALALVEARKIDVIAYPFWDNALETYWRDERPSDKAVFFEQLHQWIVPPYLQPIAYPGDDSTAPESQRTVLYQRVEDQSDALIAASLTTFFLEAGLPVHADAIKPFLSRFPNDAGATTVLAQVTLAQGQQEQFRDLAERLVRLTPTPSGRYLPWALRINLAAVLLQSGHNETALTVAHRCVEEIEASRLDSASPRTLFRLISICRNLGIQLSDTQLAQLTSRLPPPFITQTAAR